MVHLHFIGLIIWDPYKKLQEELKVMQIISYWVCWIININLYLIDHYNKNLTKEEGIEIIKKCIKEL